MSGPSDRLCAGCPLSPLQGPHVCTASAAVVWLFAGTMQFTVCRPESLHLAASTAACKSISSMTGSPVLLWRDHARPTCCSALKPVQRIDCCFLCRHEPPVRMWDGPTQACPLTHLGCSAAPEGASQQAGHAAAAPTPAPPVALQWLRFVLPSRVTCYVLRTWVALQRLQEPVGGLAMRQLDHLQSSQLPQRLEVQPRVAGLLQASHARAISLAVAGQPMHVALESCWRGAVVQLVQDPRAARRHVRRDARLRAHTLRTIT